MIARLLTRLAARHLSKHGHDVTRARKLSVARTIREELGLRPDNRLVG